MTVKRSQSVPRAELSTIAASERSLFWLFTLIAVAYPLSSLVRRVVDRSRAVQDGFGTVHVVSDGRVGNVVQMALTVLILVLAAHVVLRALRRSRLWVSPWAMVALASCVTETLRPDRDALQVAVLAATFIVLVAGGVSELTPRIMATIARVTVLTAASLLIFAMAVPAQGWAECRPDKCSPVGALLIGYFPQENMVGMYLATMLPTLAYLTRDWKRRVALVLILACIVMTGSRTAMAAILLALSAYAILRRRANHDRRRRNGTEAVGLVPLGGFLFSLGLIFFLPENLLTGRGFIFAIIRKGWEEAPLLGPGRGVLLDAYESSALIWLAAHEHSEAAYILAQAGLVGLAFMLLALLSIHAACRRSGGPVPAVFALVPALGFLTEPIWEFSLHSLCFVSLLLTAALHGHSRHGDALLLPESQHKAQPLPGI